MYRSVWPMLAAPSSPVNDFSKFILNIILPLHMALFSICAFTSSVVHSLLSGLSLLLTSSVAMVQPPRSRCIPYLFSPDLAHIEVS